MRKVTAFLARHRESAAYIAAGILTTVVNYVVYSALTVFFRLDINLSNVAAWAAAVLVAFLTNKAFVFRKCDWSPQTVFREGLLFAGSRLLSGMVGIVLLPVLIALGVTQGVLGIPGFAAKFLAECIALVLSYVLSKYAVFRS